MYIFSFIYFGISIFHLLLIISFLAEVAELVDALASEASGGNPVEVQVLSSAPMIIRMYRHLFCVMLTQSKKSSITILSSLPGPVEIRTIFLAKIDSMASIKCCASLGRSSIFVMPAVD